MDSMKMAMKMNMTDMNMTGMGNMSGMGDMGMSMYFHFGNNESALWFKFWSISTVVELLLSCLAIFCLSFCFELLKSARRMLHRCSSPSESKQILTGSGFTGRVRSRMTKAHAVQSLMYGAQVLVGMILMLVFMTYNVWLCAAMILGAIVGFAFFGEVGSGEGETCH